MGTPETGGHGTRDLEAQAFCKPFGLSSEPDCLRSEPMGQARQRYSLPSAIESRGTAQPMTEIG